MSDSVYDSIGLSDEYTIDEEIDTSALNPVNSEVAPSTKYEIYVGSLPMGTTEEDVRGVFEKYGDIECIVMKANSGKGKNGHTGPFCFVAFSNKSSIQEIVRDCPHFLKNSELFVQEARRTRKSRDRSSSDSVVPKKVFVGGIDPTITTEALKEHFEQYGEVEEAFVITDKYTGASKCFGYVTFVNEHTATAVCNDPEAAQIGTSPVEVKPCISREASRDYGKGKGNSWWSKGKGKGRGYTYNDSYNDSYNEHPYHHSKGKSKGKSYDDYGKGKGKGKSRDYSSWQSEDRGYGKGKYGKWDSYSYNDYSGYTDNHSSYGKGKGKASSYYEDPYKQQDMASYQQQMSIPNAAAALALQQQHAAALASLYGATGLPNTMPGGMGSFTPTEPPKSFSYGKPEASLAGQPNQSATLQQQLLQQQILAQQGLMSQIPSQNGGLQQQQLGGLPQFGLGKPAKLPESSLGPLSSLTRR